MAEFKLVIGLKDGKCVQRNVNEAQAKTFLEKKIGDVVKGEIVDLSGWEFKITGGSDKSGIPMRRDVKGTARKRILSVKGVGVKNKKDMKGKRTMKGMRSRTTMAGNTIFHNTAQVNVKAIKEGSTPIEHQAAEKKTK